ncbi:MAG: rod shape-determining protein [Candidatus Cloacimonetes bacterium]|jgi:rod shape-determining protein MreB|nr:rod shape-determining protein [Candidatus Syntrophosphaera sp.]NLA44185.1 rod shape-determining protein [Candidatus Cloacimonadota bacterium]HNU98112.1 rod shape-determining protein [Candidatus Syntrophosphaera thermopropionivorans]HNZ44504.1 rod shape-determining protein [Candidatus Syntrophosphaera thermopropionivorans]HOQ83498.1 rod shape-determining protein [Candidatus Syntrophosphaera thermopropionivorans]
MSFFGILGMKANDIAIDLGTANTLVYKKNAGVVINEPSVVAVSSDNKRIIAIGQQAKVMLGKNPDEVKVIKPMKDGVIADFQVTELMLRDLILRAQKKRLLVRPRVIVCVPSGITEVEKRAVRDSALHAGAREVYLVSEPVAAAIGADLPIEEAFGNMIMDIGGGTTEIALISLSHIVVHNSIRVGGDKMDNDIINYLRKKNNLHVGLLTAEKIKTTIGSAYPLKEELTMEVRGRDIVSGFPVTIKISSEEIREALSETVSTIVDSIKRLFERTAPELAADIAERGIYLTGGGALLKGLDEKISKTVDLPVYVVPDALECVVKGAGKVLDDIDHYREVLIKRIED